MTQLAAMDGIRVKTQQNIFLTFQFVLLALHSYQATDPRDKVFALLGLATDADDPTLHPDYNLSVEDVYRKTAIFLLRQDRSIAILSNSGIGNWRKHKDLPSWVPQ
jgi:hypothetical protein